MDVLRKEQQVKRHLAKECSLSRDWEVTVLVITGVGVWVCVHAGMCARVRAHVGDTGPRERGSGER